MHRLGKAAIFTMTIFLSSPSMGDRIKMCNPTPIPVASPPPETPTLKLPAPVSGYAVLEYTVTEQGNVTDVELIQAYAPPEVPGLAAVKKWQ